MATREGGLAVAVDDTVRFAMPVAAPMQSIRWEVTSYHSEPPKRLHVEWAGRRVLYIEWHEAIEMLTQKKEGVAVAGLSYVRRRPVSLAHFSMSDQFQHGRPPTVHGGFGSNLRTRHWSTVERLTPSRSAISVSPTGSVGTPAL